MNTERAKTRGVWQIGPKAAKYRTIRWAGKLLYVLPRLNQNDCVLLIVDVQTRLLPEMWEAERVERNIRMLASMARRLGIPIVVSEQNPEKLGTTVASIREAIGPFDPAAKMRFSAWEAVKDQIDRPQILLCGLESHICVSQTALDALDDGKTVFAIYDAISSRQSPNRSVGWERMKGAGALPSSTEAALYELLGEAGTDDFRAMLALVK
ncbi:isochorismatase family protein [bacterium]|nr:MAG: isochorismatase family protein [bacterium]